VDTTLLAARARRLAELHAAMHPLVLIFHVLLAPVVSFGRTRRLVR
jgi:hypothetical protein